MYPPRHVQVLKPAFVIVDMLPAPDPVAVGLGTLITLPSVKGAVSNNSIHAVFRCRPPSDWETGRLAFLYRDSRWTFEWAQPCFPLMRVGEAATDPSVIRTALVRALRMAMDTPQDPAPLIIVWSGHIAAGVFEKYQLHPDCEGFTINDNTSLSFNKLFESIITPKQRKGDHPQRPFPEAVFLIHSPAEPSLFNCVYLRRSVSGSGSDSEAKSSLMYTGTLPLGSICAHLLLPDRAVSVVDFLFNTSVQKYLSKQTNPNQNNRESLSVPSSPPTFDSPRASLLSAQSLPQCIDGSEPQTSPTLLLPAATSTDAEMPQAPSTVDSAHSTMSVQTTQPNSHLSGSASTPQAEGFHPPKIDAPSPEAARHTDAALISPISRPLNSRPHESPISFLSPAASATFTLNLCVAALQDILANLSTDVERANAVNINSTTSPSINEAEFRPFADQAATLLQVAVRLRPKRRFSPGPDSLAWFLSNAAPKASEGDPQWGLMTHGDDQGSTVYANARYSSAIRIVASTVNEAYAQRFDPQDDDPLDCKAPDRDTATDSRASTKPLSSIPL